MMTRVRAAVCREFGKPLVVEDVEPPAPGPAEIRVRLAACAICRSDIHYMEGAWGGPLPAVYGHEAAGVVAETGRDAAGLEPGDRVVVTLIRSCGACPGCSRAPVLCQAPPPTRMLKGRAGEVWPAMNTGAFAEEVVVDASQVAKVREGMPFETAALLACGVITGFGAVANVARVEPGASVAVIGAGAVGVNSIQAARIAGAERIVAVDVSAAKAEAARAFGATDAVATDALDGVRADYVFVTVGAKPAIEQGLRMVRRGGTIVIVGMPASGVKAEFDPLWLADGSRRILGTKMGSSRIHEDIPRLVELYDEGRLKLDELVSGRYPLERINEAIVAMEGGEALRNVIVFPHAERP